MKMFLFKCFCILSIMSISVLAGMQMASSGMNKMKGSILTNGQNIPPINIQNQQQGSDAASHDLLLKQKKFAEMNAFNPFSSIGKKLADGLTKASDKVIQSIVK